VAWAENATASLNIPDEEYFWASDKQHNPQRKTVWTGIYYDYVAKDWMVSCVRCYQAVDVLTFTLRVTSEDLMEGAMIIQVLHCPNCQGTDIVKHGKSPEGKQRYKCRETACDGRTFILDYAYPGQSRQVKQQIVDMALNGSGVRDTARVLHVSPSTVIRELKKRTYTPASQSSGVKATESRAC
jgi:transposase-like protein